MGLPLIVDLRQRALRCHLYVEWTSVRWIQFMAENEKRAPPAMTISYSSLLDMVKKC